MRKKLGLALQIISVMLRIQIASIK